MDLKNVYTQEELLKAIEESFIPVCRGDGEFTATGSAQVRAYSSAQVRAYDSAQVTAYGSAQVRAYDNAQVTAYDSAQVRAYDSAQVRAYSSAQVTACGSAQVTATGSAQVRAYSSAQVTAYDSAQVTAYGSAQVTATTYVAVTIRPGFLGKINGGVQIVIPPVETAAKWCEYYGIPVTDGVVVLYKAVDEDYATERSRDANVYYKPGTQPSAPDWNGGIKECGGGLHFCPTPIHALAFNQDAVRFVACPVKLDEVVVHYPASYPQKVKAPRVCAPCYEVDINGKAI